MATYIYTRPGADLGRLQSELISAGMPVDYINGSGDEVHVITSRDLTPAEQTSLAALVAAHDGRLRRPRIVHAILADITALTTAQQSLVWTQLSSGLPPLLALDAGPNAASVFVMQFLGTAVGGLTTAEKNEGRRRAIAFYVQDNPLALVRPVYDATINVPGDEPYTP